MFPSCNVTVLCATYKYDLVTYADVSYPSDVEKSNVRGYKAYY